MPEKVKLFVSFRFRDGNETKEELIKKLDDYIINKSEDKDRSEMTEETIKKYLYDKLKDTSVTIVLLTPEAINYKKNIFGKYDDWLYDELRYSLQDREGNRTNGVIAVYTEDSKHCLIQASTHECNVCKEKSSCTTILGFENLVRKNMFNIKSRYRKEKCEGLYDSLEDHYISLVSYDDFIANPQKYIENCIDKRERLEEFDLMKEM